MKDERGFVVLAAAMLFVFLQHEGKKLLVRTGISGASGGMGYGMAPEVATAVSWLGEYTAMALITALIYAALDFAFSLLADKEAIIDLLRARFGGRKS